MGTDGTRVGMPEKHPGWSQPIWTLSQDLSLSPLDQWLPMCGTGNLCCVPRIPANTNSMENKAQVQWKQNPSWNKQSRRWGRMQTEIRDWNKEFEKRQPGLNRWVWERMNEGCRGKDEVEDLCFWGGNLLLPTPSVPAGRAKLLCEERTPSRCKVGSKGHPCSPVPSNYAVRHWFSRRFFSSCASDGQ